MKEKINHQSPLQVGVDKRPKGSVTARLKGSCHKYILLATAKKRLFELERLIQSTYEDKVLGKIPKALCVRLISGYQSEQEENRRSLKNWKRSLQEWDDFI